MFADVLTSTNALDKRGFCLQMSTHFPSENSVQIEKVKDGRFYCYLYQRRFCTQVLQLLSNNTKLGSFFSISWPWPTRAKLQWTDTFYCDLIPGARAKWNYHSDSLSWGKKKYRGNTNYCPFLPHSTLLFSCRDAR